MMLRFSGAGVSEVGLRREHNEDSAFVGPYVALVADGVGGAAAGEVASATATFALTATALARFGDPVDSVLRSGVAAARQNVRRGVDLDVARVGMATTLTAVATDGRRIVLAHLGDSRAYTFRRGRLRLVSRDHTAVQDLIDRGEITPAEARHHPWRNVVLRSIGADTGVPVDDADLTELSVDPGDRILLCSDGLTDLVSETRIGEVLRLRDPHSAAAVLTHAALDAGGTDNVTCVVLDVVAGPLVVGDGQLLGAVRDVANLVDPGFVGRP
jgi:protein phosphatase